MKRSGLFLFNDSSNIADNHVYYSLDYLTQNFNQVGVVVNNLEFKSALLKATKPLKKLSKLLKNNNKKSVNLEDEYFVSVIMASYNRKDIISDSIDSVLDQTFKNFELIIIDDGSDDGTEDFINKKYSNFDEINSHFFSKVKLSKSLAPAKTSFKFEIIVFISGINSINPSGISATP